ncbi:SDR family NAD(P)-dependent oxidoreductase [Ancylobacter terrae]|uniref:SDR family NAD(P)-dependent oxidoreductase n=1 Tax=Ancylobacter sp. sgz301288 TaxID=3342077 RepID=UPI00385909E0
MSGMSVLKKLVPAPVKAKIKAYVLRNAPALPVAVPYQIRLVGKDRLKGQVAVVTGGSGAIGRAICCHLAAEGAIVYVCGTSDARMGEVVSEIAALGGTAHAQKLDVGDEGAIRAAFAAIGQAHGRIDILVNCAGGSAREDHGAIIDQKTSVIDAILTINLRGTMLCVREAARIMVGRGYGRIINVSSIIGERGKANFAEYAASKAGVIVFTKSIAMELGTSGITANCVSPGIVQRGAITGDMIEQLKKTNWLGGYGKPEDIASMVSYLVSDEAAFITGQNMIVDGGRSLGLKGD